MPFRNRLAFYLVLAAALAGILYLWGIRPRTLTGVVRDEEGHPIAGAVVRIRASRHATTSDAEGRFELSGFPPAFKPRLTAWADGYYIAGRAVWPWSSRVVLTLSPYAVPDHDDYRWIPPAVEERTPWQQFVIRARLDPTAALAPDALFFKAADGLELGCRDCHGDLIYAQWIGGSHALGLANRRFASMYNGSDLSGERHSPATRTAVHRDYGRVPLPPDPAQPYFGPGYKLDFPDTAGNCAACHLPAAALADPYGTDPNLVTGVDAQGSHCDFCHKIVAVRLDPETGIPYENMPGVLSLVMMRPSPEKQVFFGPYDDVDAGSDTFLPLQIESQYCAPCHDASFWGEPIYKSFSEWLASPYSDPRSGKTCQDCHMKADGVTTNFAPGRAGQERAPESIPSHDFPGASSEELLQNAVTMSVAARLDGDRLIVTVDLANDLTGHHVPTDSPLRHLILLVRAHDSHGAELAQTDGPTVPDWGGVGDPRQGYYAGLPGKAFAKILREMWTEVSPTGAYWNPTVLVSDNRLAAFARDRSSYAFRAAPEGILTVEVTLLFRRAFKELMDQKGWQTPDIVMEQQVITVPLAAGP